MGVLLATLAAAQFPGGQRATVPSPAVNASDLADRLVLLRRVRLESFRYQRELPDFIYDLQTTRTVDASGTGKHWKQRDELQVEDVCLSGFVNHKLIAVNGKTATKNYHALDGFLSETVLPSVGFLPAWLFGSQVKTKFEWLREDTIGDSKVQVFSLHVAPSDSKFMISTRRQSFVAGIDGEIFVDSARAVVRRFQIRLDLPANSPLQDGMVDIQYGPVAISSRQFFLPVRFEVSAHDGASLVKNETRVVRYQKYSAQTTIYFDSVPPDTPEVKK
jgi:hypothetical protein